MSKKIVKTYVTFSFLLSLSHAFFFATYQLFLASRGMNLLEINIINMFFMAGVFLLEVPTGAFADVFGRKKSIVTGCFMLSLSMLVYFFGNGFLIFVVAELIGALGLTFLSGALEAWVVDALAYHGYDGELSHVFRREVYATQLGVIFGSLLGGYLGERDLSLPWLASAIATFAVGFFAIFTLKEQPIERTKFAFSFAPFRKTIKSSISFGYQNKSVWFVVLFGMLLAISVQALNMQWPFVFQKTYGFSTAHLGWLFAAVSGITMLGGQLSKFFAERIQHEKNAIILSQGVTAVGIIGASLMFGVVPTLSMFLLHEMGRGMIGPLKQAYLNHRIPSEQRATILSFDSMIGKAGSFVGLLGSGYLAQHAGIPVTWLASGIVLAVGILVFFNLKNGD
ncbi:MAG: MFS transporter [Parcubacteria group bacterium]